jgi:DNA-binding response OmpR family regulator
MSSDGGRVAIDYLEFDPKTRVLVGPAGRIKLVGDVARLMRVLMQAGGQTASVDALSKACRRSVPWAVSSGIHRCRRRIERVGADRRLIRTDRGRGYALALDRRVERTFTPYQLALLGEVLATHPNQTAAAVIRAALSW